MEAKTVVVTGVTGTIGKATALELSGKVQNLILIGRNTEKLNKVKAEIHKISPECNVETVLADLSEFHTILNATKYIQEKHPTIDALVNIAAIFNSERSENSSGQEYMFATNHLGPFILTNLLLDPIRFAGGKVITITAPSTTKVNFKDINGKEKYSAGFLGMFGATKMMNILFAYSLANKLEGSGAISMAFHPGLVKSGLTRNMPGFLRSIVRALSGKPDKAAKKITELVINPTELKNNGKFFRYDGKEIKSSDYSYDRDIQDKLWHISEEIEKKVLQEEAILH